MGELSAEEETVYDGIGREFLSLIETTDMQKVYKMPVLYSFYNHGRTVRSSDAGSISEAYEGYSGLSDNGVLPAAVLCGCREAGLQQRMTLEVFFIFGFEIP